MKLKALVFATLLLSTSPSYSQEALSLRDCAQMAVEKNINVVTTRMDLEKSGDKIAEVRALMLPQINMGGNFTNNLKLPVTVLPGDFLGKPGTLIPVQMGVQYNTNVGVSVNQMIYDQTRISAMKIAKQAENLSQLGVEKASETIVVEVSKLYYLIQTTSEQETLLKGNIERIERMAEVIITLVTNGMSTQVDFDRISVTQQNLQTQLDNTHALLEQQVNMLKFLLQISEDKEIELTESVEVPLLDYNPELNVNFSEHIDVQMLESQKQLNHLNMRNINNGYLPNLSFVGQYAVQGLRKNFQDYFREGGENHWYGAAYVGINLSVPIFDGFNRRSKYRQAKVEYFKNDLMLENTEERLNIDYKNALNNYHNNKNNVLRQKQNIDLAEQVYRETELKYRQGQSSLSDLLQDEMSLSNAQSGYLNALYNFKEAELRIMSLNGNIRNLFD